MANWIFCDCCSGCNLAMNERRSGIGGASIQFTTRPVTPSGTGTGTHAGFFDKYTGTGSGSGSCGFAGQSDELKCDWTSNAVASVRVSFSSKKIADRILGDGNYRIVSTVAGLLYRSKTDDDDVFIASDDPYNPYAEGPSDKYLLFSDNEWKRGNNEGEGTGSLSGEVSAKLTVDTVVFVAPDGQFVGYNVPMSISINDHVWMRKNNCPVYVSGDSARGYDWGDFQIWELQTSIFSDDQPPEAGPHLSGQTYCMSIEIVSGAASVAWKTPEQSVTASVINHAVRIATGQPCLDGLCEYQDDTLCLSLDINDSSFFKAQLVDGWMLGGTWRGSDRLPVSGTGSHHVGTGTGTEQLCRTVVVGSEEDHCAPQTICNSAVLMMQGGIVRDNQGWERQYQGFPWPTLDYCILGRLAWDRQVFYLEKRVEDVRTLPDKDEWTDTDLMYGGAGAHVDCGGDLDKLVFGGGCHDGGGGGDTDGVCPPPDCIASYCEFTWDPDTFSWSITHSSCVEPSSTCPDEPPTPTDPSIVHVVCICCDVITPPGPCEGGASACEGTCFHTWSTGGGGHWLTTSACVTPIDGSSCSCTDPPTRPGLFNGEMVEGVCCPGAGDGGGGGPL